MAPLSQPAETAHPCRSHRVRSPVTRALLRSHSRRTGAGAALVPRWLDVRRRRGAVSTRWAYSSKSAASLLYFLRPALAAAFVIGWAAGGLAQPDAYSLVDDSVSDLGALSADQAWIYNQVGANLTGLLVAALAYGLWKAGIPGFSGRIGVIALAVMGIGQFFDGWFRLDCRAIDAGCSRRGNRMAGCSARDRVALHGSGSAGVGFRAGASLQEGRTLARPAHAIADRRLRHDRRLHWFLVRGRRSRGPSWARRVVRLGGTCVVPTAPGSPESRPAR